MSATIGTTINLNNLCPELVTKFPKAGMLVLRKVRQLKIDSIGWDFVTRKGLNIIICYSDGLYAIPNWNTLKTEFNQQVKAILGEGSNYQYNDNFALPQGQVKTKWSNWVLTHNAVCLAVNIFNPINQMKTEEQATTYVNWAFDNIVGPAVEGFKPIPEADLKINQVVLQLQSSISNQLSSTTQSLQITESDIQTHQTRMKGLYEKVILEKQKLEAIKKAQNTSRDHLLRELKSIESLPFVKKVSFTTEGVCVEVGDIKLQRTLVGTFKLVIGSQIRCINTDTKRVMGAYHHPHISTNGNRMCYGSTRAAKIAELHGSMQIRKLVFMLYAFLRSYNQKDCYHRIDDWKKFNENLEQQRLPENGG